MTYRPGVLEENPVEICKYQLKQYLTEVLRLLHVCIFCWV
jgi:hypothetical protein